MDSESDNTSTPDGTEETTADQGGTSPMDQARALYERARERLNATSPTVRLVALSAVGLLVAALGLFASSGSVGFDTLYSGLTPDDTSRIVERLGRMGVPFEMEAGTIRVPSEQVHDTRLTLAGEGLPSGGGSGFELFDEQRFGESEFTEQIQYHRALEGELSRTIGHLDGVERARVHLVLPERSLFVERDGRASASVVLHLSPGWRVREAQAGGIVHLVASSVRGLNPDNVTLVDGEGRPITDEEEDPIGDSLAFRQRIESDKELSLQALLDETVGPGIARVEVSAEVNFRREEHTEERYHPEEVAPRSFQIEEERDPAGDNNAEGVPGAASNLPGGAANEGGTNDQGLRRRSETRNFEVSKTVRHAVEPVGRVVRQSIAVVVDGTWEGDTFTPRPEEELERIAEIARTAAGIDAERGDTLTVTCVPFSRDLDQEPVDPLAPIRPYEPYFPYAAGALGFLLLPILLLLLKKKLAARKKAAEEAAKAALEAENADKNGGSAHKLLSGSDGEQLLDTKEITPGAVRDVLLGQGDTKAAELASEVQNLAAELAAEDTLRASRIIRGWILSDMPEDTGDEEGAEEEAA